MKITSIDNTTFCIVQNIIQRVFFMDNFKNLDNKYRRYKAHVSIFGTTQFHLRNPYTIAWWSAAFPGFGHFLLSKYLLGLILFIWEVFVNYQAYHMPICHSTKLPPVTVITVAVLQSVLFPLITIQLLVDRKPHGNEDVSNLGTSLDWLLLCKHHFQIPLLRLLF
jgi:hypothetical protein